MHLTVSTGRIVGVALQNWRNMRESKGGCLNKYAIDANDGRISREHAQGTSRPDKWLAPENSPGGCSWQRSTHLLPAPHRPGKHSGCNIPLQSRYPTSHPSSHKRSQVCAQHRSSRCHLGARHRRLCPRRRQPKRGGMRRTASCFCWFYAQST